MFVKLHLDKVYRSTASENYISDNSYSGVLIIGDAPPPQINVEVGFSYLVRGITIILIILSIIKIV